MVSLFQKLQFCLYTARTCSDAGKQAGCCEWSSTQSWYVHGGAIVTASVPNLVTAAKMFHLLLTIITVVSLHNQHASYAQ